MSGSTSVACWLVALVNGSVLTRVSATAAPAVNPELLRELARATGGLAFTAGDDAALASSFERIRAELSASELRVVGTTADRELFVGLVLLALALLALELLLSMTRLRRFP